ncbi:BPL-N domain-containing protein [Haloferula sp. BvORR071]|uniref:BPL-N domain-containing protein n=1 Tax=Haloferula sp. BvORR071 TaxID=1396141 RepID=UPI002240F2E6|nr:BPL-N domain-containing protein [Haloferula sp. BvORR071]
MKGEDCLCRLRRMRLAAGLAFVLGILAPIVLAEEAPKPIRVGVLSASDAPAANTSQGLYIKILKDAGMEAGPVSAQMVKDGALDKLDLFIIGGGSGTAFNKSLGPDGGAKVEAFVKKGGGAMGSCAGGYSFVRGHNEALRYIEIANAVCIDTENGRWVRGSGEVMISPRGEGLSQRKIFYANGPLWKITDAPGFGRTEALATFVTDMKKEGDPGGVMPGTPAILAGSFGEGRYVLFSAHPEFKWKYGNTPMIVDAARWVVRGKLPEEEKINYAAVFPSMSEKAAKE